MRARRHDAIVPKTVTAWGDWGEPVEALGLVGVELSVVPASRQCAQRDVQDGRRFQQ